MNAIRIDQTIKSLFIILVLATGTLGTIHAQNISKSGVEPQEIQTIRNEAFNLRKTAPRAVVFDETDVLSNPNASMEAVALYRYIQDMFGKKSLAGQQWVQWGNDEMDYIENVTGKLPAIAGFDYINESQNAVENQRAIDYWNDGGIVTIMYHQGAPSIGEGYENSKETIDIDQVFIEDTPEYIDFWGDLERIADHLQVLEDANVPVLWRPFHELTGNWFWWSKGGSTNNRPESFKKLWIAMYDYMVNERELDNLIWVLCYTASPSDAWYPGDAYVDLAGADTYDNTKDSHLSMFNATVAAVGEDKFPIVFHENGNPPDPQECIRDGAMWSWWMIWHTDWLYGTTDQSADLDHIQEVYESDLVITLDEIPDIVSTYSWDATCSPSNVAASVVLGDGETYEENNIGLNDGQTSVTLQVSSEDEGTWSWSGYGLTDDSDLAASSQEISIDGLGTTNAQFTNTCGAVTTQTFNVLDGYVNNIPLAVSDGITNSLISVYPSPATTSLTIDFTKLEGYEMREVKIFDINGSLLLEETISSQSHKIDISELNTGIYGLVATGGGYNIVRKFIKE